MTNTEVHPDVIGLAGGKKQFWLRIHRREIEEFLFNHAPEETCQRFNLKQDTLDRFLDRKNNDIRLSKLSQADKAVLEIAMQGDRDLKRRIIKLEEWAEGSEPVLQVTRGIILTLDQMRIQSGNHRRLKVPKLLPDSGKKSEKQERKP